MGSSPFDPFLGKTIAGRYRVDSRLGEGGIGAVYVAEHLSLGKRVALKVLHERFASTADARARFEREARALSALTHPNVVSVIDFGNEDGALFLVMELVDGESLGDRIRRGMMPRPIALDIVRQILRALAYAHAHHIVHRDLKPANVLVRSLPDGSEHVVVLDFGLAKFVDTSGVELTRHGVILGTPAYMSPEQATGDAANAPADVYAATLILFELLTGQRAYAGREAGELFKAHLIAPIPSLGDTRQDSAYSPALEALVKKGLAKRPGDRFTDARAMLEAFDALPELSERVSGRVSNGTATTRIEGAGHGAAAKSGTSRATWILGGLAAIIGAAGLVAIGFLANVFGSSVPVVPERPAAIDAGLSMPLVLGVDAGFDAGFDAGLDAGMDAGLDAGVDAAVPASNRTPARDPFAEALPADLQPLATAIGHGAQPARENLQVLFQYGAGHRTDPRAHLLLGHTFTDRGWATDALDAYREAHFRDSTSRGDPRMLQDLVGIASSARVRPNDRDRARGYLGSFYGPESLPYLAARVAEATDPETKAALDQLRQALVGVP